MNKNTIIASVATAALGVTLVDNILKWSKLNHGSLVVSLNWCRNSAKRFNVCLICEAHDDFKQQYGHLVDQYHVH